MPASTRPLVSIPLRRSPAPDPSVDAGAPPGVRGDNAAFGDHQRRLLVAEHAGLAARLADSERQVRSWLASEPIEVSFDEEGGEGGTITSEMQREEAMQVRLVAQVAEIEAALDRIARKTYGRCEACDGDIGIVRLEALPVARLCVACKSAGPLRRR